MGKIQHRIANKSQILGARIIRWDVIQTFQYHRIQVHISTTISIQCQQSQEIRYMLTQETRLKQSTSWQPFFGRCTFDEFPQIHIPQMDIWIGLQFLDKYRCGYIRILVKSTRRCKQYKNIPVGIWFSRWFNSTTLSSQTQIRINWNCCHTFTL